MLRDISVQHRAISKGLQMRYGALTRTRLARWLPARLDPGRLHEVRDEFSGPGIEGHRIFWRPTLQAGNDDRR
jgi:hypothetical protein